MYTINIDYSPNERDNALIKNALVSFNEKKVGGKEKPLSIFLKDDKGELMGGLIGWFDHETLWVDILWIDDSLRKKGYGKKLLNTAEKEARKQGCTFLRLDTWSFQAEEFYLKCGYQRVAEIKNHWLSYSKIFFKKNLNANHAFDTLIIDETLARTLVASQFPQWKDLSIRPVINQGWDNRTFYLGEKLLLRIPSSTSYALQVEKEQHWLPILAPMLPLPIPSPVVMGEPQDEYPWHWSIYRYLPGESASTASISNQNQFAKTLAEFLTVFQKIDTTNGPPSGFHSFYRGGDLNTYDAETRQATAILKGKIDQKKVIKIWEEAVQTKWKGPPVWVHGDISPGNLLVENGQLTGVIDFGQLAIGDPACDLAITWTFFKKEARETFREYLSLDADTWKRSQAWALWKALIVASNLIKSNSFESKECWRIMGELLKDP